jgi:hypothetical protein
MSALPLAAPAVTSIDANDPSLNTPQDYAVFHFRPDGSAYLADRFLNLAPAMQRYVLALAVAGPDGREIAERVANCCRAGSVSHKCRHGRYAKAHKHHCGDHLCVSCCSGRYKFNKWAAKRDHAAFLLQHDGLEVKYRRAIKPTQSPIGIMWKLRAAVTKLIPRLTPNSVSVEAFAEQVSDTAIRIVFPGKGTHSYTQMRGILAELGMDEDLIVINKRGTPEELFHWAFGGFHDCAAMAPERKAGLRVRIVNHHTICTTGKLYSTLSKEQLAERAAAAPSEPCLCPVCKDHDLDEVPREERSAQSVEDIHSQYEHVDWSAEHFSPFEKHIRKDDPTDKCGGPYSDRSIVSAAPSPPPW